MQNKNAVTTSNTYIKFLEILLSKRPFSDFPLMDIAEEGMLNMFAVYWLKGDPITVLDAMQMIPDISKTTAHRRIKTLRMKGMIALEVNADDNRIKHVVKTELSEKYFIQLDRYMRKAFESQAH